MLKTYPNPFLDIRKSAPAFPKCFQWSKTDHKMIAKSPNISKKNSKSHAFSGPSLADCAKRFQSTIEIIHRSFISQRIDVYSFCISSQTVNQAINQASNQSISMLLTPVASMLSTPIVETNIESWSWTKGLSGDGGLHRSSISRNCDHPVKTCLAI